MARTNYQAGRAFEYRTRDKLLEMGAAYVIRAAQSRGKVDLLALWPLASKDRSWIVQCKRDGRLPKVERQALLDLWKKTGAIPILAKAGAKGRGVEFVFLP